jgi:hypothetical protein
MSKKQLQVTKISTHGRIYLGNVVMEKLNAQTGDHVQIV